MDLKLKTKLEMFRNTEHENFYNGSSKGMGTISSNTADEMYELINELERALIKEETSQDEALNLAVVSGSASNPVVNEKNSPYCTYNGDCYQTIACRAGGKKLCKHRLLNVD